MRFPQVVLALPDWVERFLPDAGRVYDSVEARMRLVIELARLNVRNGTGGPFGAAIFDQDRQTLLAPGVNIVVPSACAVAHAEMMAIMVAQRVVGSFDLGHEGLPACELVSSTAPCAMCLGAIPWSGVRRLICGARDEDARRIGFDEGAKPSDWPQSLERHGIAVVQDVCRAEAVAVLEEYARRGGIIYNSRQ